MTQFQLSPILETDLPSVARFLVNWHSTREDSQGSVLLEYTDRLEKRLRWRLVENPLKRPNSDVGLCLRSDNQSIVGTILFFPSAFVLGTEKLTGLCSCEFFVDPAARPNGLILLLEYLKLPGYDFYFGTTFNTNSGAIFKRLGGLPVAGSAFEYFIPLRLGPICREFALAKKWHPALVYLAKSFGVLGTPVLGLRHRRIDDLVIRQCTDWEYLSSIAERLRDPTTLTSDRSAEYLQWRYGDCPSPNTKEVYLYRDKEGNEGWFALDITLRGRTKHIRTMIVLDIVCPKNPIVFEKVISRIVQLSICSADMVLLVGRPAFSLQLKRSWIIQRKLPGPSGYLIASPEIKENLAKSADFVFADGDSGI